MTRVKICGIKSIEDARAVFEAGADELGFHVKLDGGRSPLTEDEARNIISQIPPTASSVVVTSISDATDLIALARSTGAGTLQLYGGASREQVREVKHMLPMLKIWKVVDATKEKALETAKKYEGAADMIVLDSGKGGTGKTHDWSVSKTIVESISTPVILAGGLNPENDAEAVATVQPAGVDVNSSVSNPDGTKDIEKVKAFIAAAKK